MDASDVERLEILRRVPRIEKNPANQEARQDKKEVYSAPAYAECAQKVTRPITQASVVRVSNIVADYHQQNGETPQTVKLRDTPCKFRMRDLRPP